MDAAGNVYIANTNENANINVATSIMEVSKVYLPGSPLNENLAGGSAAVAVPTTQALAGIFAPTSDQGWLTIGTVTNGVVNFSFTASPSGQRTAHISLLGGQIAVTQAAAAPALGFTIWKSIAAAVAAVALSTSTSSTATASRS